jgi:hypothetical protein
VLLHIGQILPPLKICGEVNQVHHNLMGNATSLAEITGVFSSTIAGSVSAVLDMYMPHVRQVRSIVMQKQHDWRRSINSRAIAAALCG